MDVGTQHQQPNSSNDPPAAQTAKVSTANRDRLARLVRMAPHFTDAIHWWAGFTLQTEQTAPTTREALTTTAARLLDVPAGTEVTRRDLHLLAPTAGSDFLAAAVTEFVYEPRLGLTLGTRRTLHHGSEPADVIVPNLYRAVWSVLRPDMDPDGVPRPSNVALQADAILTGAGRPVALTSGTVYWRLVTHRAPDALPHYVPTRDPIRRGDWP